MSRLTRVTCAAIISALLACGSLLAQTVAAPQLPGGFGRVRVAIEVFPGEDAAAVIRQLAATYRVRLEPYAEEGFVGFVGTITEAGAGLLARDPRVLRIEPLPTSRPSPAPPVEAPPAHRTAAAPTAPPMPARPFQGIASDESGSTWSTGTYLYDGSGNIKQIGTNVYRYDAYGRVTTANAGGQKQTFGYDRFGNLSRITKDDQSLGEIRPCVDPATNRLRAAPPAGSDCNAVATYDADGNMITQDLDAFAYDELGMLSYAATGGVEMVNLYTPSEERLASMRYVTTPGTRVHTGTEWTVRDLGGRILRRYSESPTGVWSWSEDYIYLGTQLVAAEVATPEKTLHFFPDHLGTPRLVTGNGGAKIAEHTYSAFGLELTSDLQDAERVKFTGHERDAASLDHMHARAYRGSLGRFLSVDPDEFWRADPKNPAEREQLLSKPRNPQNWNRYAYVMNNPVNLTDPTGKTWRESFRLFRDWLTGDGPEQRVFVPPSNQVADLKNAPQVNRAREFFLNKNAENIANGRQLQPVTDFKGKFGLVGLAKAGTNSTQQFVGSYSVDIRPMPNGTVRFTVTNTTSFKSLAYGVAPDWNRQTYPTPGGNMSQVYTWTEPVP